MSFIMKDLVLVGELNPYGSDPRFSLYHLPRRASGNRLREHLGLSDCTYEAIEKVNLCTGRWSMAAARANAGKVLGEYGVIVCLGAKVRDAFNGPKFFESGRWLLNLGLNEAECSIATLPHPSGLNRLWNQPGARQRARELMRSIAPGVPWGETD